MSHLRNVVFIIMALNIFIWPVMAQDEENTATPYDLPYIGDMRVHIAAYEDTMVKIARDNNLGFIELRSANQGVDPWMPGEHTKIILPTRHLLPDAPRKGIVINLPEMRIYSYPKDGSTPSSHPIGVGREGLDTPLGTTTVTRKMIGPSWRPTARMRSEDPSLPAVITPGPDNPLGTHALYLGWPAYLIHGTNKPFGIGRRSSSGCIRMYPEDIVNFYDAIDINTAVRVVDQPVKAAWIDNVLYLEAHTSLDQADLMEQEGKVTTYEITEADIAIILKAADDKAGLLDWRKIRNIIRDRQGIPLPIAIREDV